MEDTNIREAALAHAKDLHTDTVADKFGVLHEGIGAGIDDVLSDAQAIYEFLTNSHQTEPTTVEYLLSRGFLSRQRVTDAFLKGQTAPAQKSDVQNKSTDIRSDYGKGRKDALDELLSLGREAHYEADSLVRGSVVLSAIEQVRARV